MATNKFPFFDITRQYEPLHEAVMDSFSKLLKSQSLILGEATAKFEKDMAAWMGVKHAITVASGTDSLILGLRALGVQAGDQVITPAFSFFASTGAILLLGAKPVFVDIDPETYNMSVPDLKKKLHKGIKAIMPVHLYGQTANMTQILELAQSAGVPVIEDFAQSIGATHFGRPAGGMGQIGATSFYPTKNLGGAGEGGLISTNDDALADKVKVLRVHGMRQRYYHEVLGYNSRMDALQCAYLSVKLPHLKTWTEKRAALAQRYLSELRGLEGKGLTLPVTQPGSGHVWNQFVVRLKKRDQVKSFLAENGIPTEIYYPLTIPAQKPLREICPETGWPESERAAQEVLALPIFPELKSEEQAQVITGLKEALG